MLNEVAEIEYPPAFEDIGEGLAHLDQVEAQAIKDMEEAARERMQLDQEDPTKQSYYLRLDRNTIVKTESEFVACQLSGVPMKVVPFSTAVHVLKVNEAKARQAKKVKQQKKVAKKARKRNR